VAEGRVGVRWLRVWAVPALVAIAAAGIAFARADVPLFLMVNHSALGSLDGFWQNVTVLGDGVVAMAMMLALYRRRPDLFWAAFIAAILVSLSIQFGKFVRPIPRPLGQLGPEVVRVIGEEFHNASFPSGHAATAFALAAILWTALRSPIARVLLVLAACLVALSRVIVGAHWPTDVLGGGAVGWLLGLAGLELARRMPWGRARAAQAILACLFAAAAIWILAGYDTSYPAGQALAFGVGVASLAAVALTFVPRSNRGRATRDEFTT
jgi:membrane-associated phospholipid phosphatase